MRWNYAREIPKMLEYRDYSNKFIKKIACVLLSYADKHQLTVGKGQAMKSLKSMVVPWERRHAAVLQLPYDAFRRQRLPSGRSAAFLKNEDWARQQGGNQEVQGGGGQSEGSGDDQSCREVRE